MSLQAGAFAADEPAAVIGEVTFLQNGKVTSLGTQVTADCAKQWLVTITRGESLFTVSYTSPTRIVLTEAQTTPVLYYLIEQVKGSSLLQKDGDSIAIPADFGSDREDTVATAVLLAIRNEEELEDLTNPASNALAEALYLIAKELFVPTEE